MIQNFDETKKQLKELSEIINKFKSEAVQLRVVDHLFGNLEHDVEEKPVDVGEPPRKKKNSKKPARKATKDNTSNKKHGKRAAGQGAVATLMKLVDDNFFSEPKGIGDIVQHCDHNLARKFKANEFSGKLGRLVRETTLTRTKNSDGQYEYQS